MKRETIIMWVPEKYDGAKKLFKRFRDLDFKVYVASFPDLREPILWYGNGMHEGADWIDRFEKMWRKGDLN